VVRSLKNNFKLSFIIIGPERSMLSDFLRTKQVALHVVSDAEFRSWSSKLRAVYQLLKIIKPDVVHTHLWRANVIGLTAAWMLGVRKRIYTRHHALVHHEEHRKGLWLDRWCNFIATDIIAISDNISAILTDLEKVPLKKIRLIHHGFDLSYFRDPNIVSIEKVRDKWKLNGVGYPVVGVVARYQKWKGIQYIIPAFKMLLEKFPDAHLVLANAQGNYHDEIQSLLNQLPDKSYTEISFEEDSASLFQLFDLYVHTPVDAQSEAFGQTYIEALASGIPSVFTLSGVAREFIKDGENALVADFGSARSIYNCLSTLLDDESLRNKIVENGRTSVNEFELEIMMNKLKALFSN